MVSAASLWEDHLKAIGLITINFGTLESTIAQGVWSLLGLDQRIGQIITAELSFKGLVALFSSLYREKNNDAKALEELNDVIKKVIQAEEKRNVISHSQWGAGDSADTITRIKTTAKISKGLRHQFENVTVSELMKIADEIAEASSAMQFFWLDIETVPRIDFEENRQEKLKRMRVLILYSRA